MNWFTRLFRRQQNAPATDTTGQEQYLEQARQAYADDEIDMDLYERISTLILGGSSYTDARAKATREACYAEQHRLNAANNYSGDVYLRLPKQGDKLVLLVDKVFINDVLDWGGEENEAYAARLQARWNKEGDFGYEVTYQYTDPSAVVPLRDGGLAIPEDEDPTFDVIDEVFGEPGNTDSCPINRSYFQHLLAVVDPTLLGQTEPRFRTHGMWADPTHNAKEVPVVGRDDDQMALPIGENYELQNMLGTASPSRTAVNE